MCAIGTTALAHEKAAAVQYKRHAQVQADVKEQRLHTQVQYQLAMLGRALGYEVSVARNDRNACHDGVPLGYGCIPCLPNLGLPAEVHATVDLIDVLWLHPPVIGAEDNPATRIACAFEVEKSTSIYSGILRLADMAPVIAWKGRAPVPGRAA